MNRGIPGNTARDILGRLPSVLSHKPRAVVLMVGTNDLIQQRSVEQTLADTGALLAQLRESVSAVWLLAILPVREADDAVFVGFNAKARAYNDKLAAVAQAHGATFVDFSRAFADEDGELLAKLTQDGVHLTREGYALWGRELSARASFA